MKLFLESDINAGRFRRRREDPAEVTNDILSGITLMRPHGTDRILMVKLKTSNRLSIACHRTFIDHFRFYFFSSSDKDGWYR